MNQQKISAELDDNCPKANRGLFAYFIERKQDRQEKKKEPEENTTLPLDLERMQASRREERESRNKPEITPSC